MTDDRQRGSWPAFTYNGFSGPGAPPAPSVEPAPPPAQPQRNGLSRGVILGGVATAVGAGLVFGLLSRPSLDGDGAAKPARTEPVARPATMPVEVAAAPVRPAAASAPLEVLPSAPAGESAVRPRLPAPRVRPGPQVETPIVRAEPATVAQEPRAAAPPVQARPSFDCRLARSRAETMICGDPALAQLDRRLDRAFRSAVAAGVPYRQLRAEQDDWLGIREFAARRSPNDVASIYRQRIAELSEMAD